MAITVHPSVNPRRCANAILSLFSSSLAGAFDDVDTNYASEDTASFGAAIALRDIQTYYRSRLGQYDAYPCMSIFPSGFQGGEGGDKGSFLIRYPRIEIVIYELSNDIVGTLTPPEVMELRLERMVEAVEMLMDDNRTLTITGAVVAEIDQIEPPDYLDFEFSPGNPSLIRRSVSLGVQCIIK